jgi:FG-GAP-like repeat
VPFKLQNGSKLQAFICKEITVTQFNVVLKKLWLALGGAYSLHVAAQPVFTEITPTSNPYFVNALTEDFWLSSLASADVDGDADLDLVALGYYVVYNQSSQTRLLVLRNDGIGVDGQLQLVPQQISIGNLSPAGTDLSFADVDGDSDPDLVVGSRTGMALFRNDAGSFVRSNTQLPNYLEASDGLLAYDLRSISWADTDNDGDQDLLVPSAADSNGRVPTALLRNDGANGSGGFLFSDSNAGIAVTVNAQTNWADDDADGDLDLLVTNIDFNDKTGFFRIYQNNGANGFIGTDALPLRIDQGMTDWADIDSDGDLDILVAGTIEEANGFSTVLRVYRKQGTSYAPIELALPSPQWLTLSAASWADYDSDGDVDILVTGNVFGLGKLTGRSEIYANDGNGIFTALDVQLPAADTSLSTENGGGGAFTWLDIDGDRDLDYFVAGAYFLPDADGLVESRAQVFRNITSATNVAPAAPSGMAALVSAEQVTLSWLAPDDDHTEAAALSYDLQISRSNQPISAAARLPQPGNINQATRWQFKNLAPGNYQWTVKAVDAAYAGGDIARGNFVIASDDGFFASGFE